MGLFKSKEQKKAEAEAKARQQEQAKINSRINNEFAPSNDMVPTGNEKKRRQQMQQTNQHQEKARDKVEELLRNLSRELSASMADADEEAQEIRNLSILVRRMNLGQNVGTTDAILAFIERQIQDVVVKAHAGNYAAVMIFCQDIGALLNELENPASAKLFHNPKYVDVRIRVAELSAMKEDLEGQRLSEYKKRDKLKAAMEAGKIDSRIAVERANQIRASVEDLDRQLRNVQSDLSAANTALSEAKAQTLNTLEQKSRDIDTFNSLADQKADAEALSEELGDVTSRLRTNNSHVSSDDMQFHNNNKTELTAEEVENAFDF